MTRSLESAEVSLVMAATVKNTMTQDTSKSVSGQVSFLKSWDIENGVGSDAASRAWEWSGSLVSGANEVFNLSTMVGLDAGSGGGRDIVGQTLLLLEITHILIFNDNDIGDAGLLEIQPNATNGWTPIGTHTVATGGALGAQGCLFKAQPDEDGFDIGGAGVNVKLTAQSGSVDYKIVLIGRHDVEDSSSSSLSSSS